ncbi:phosphoribosyl-AMP cyclohydrolase [Pseudomonas putida]|uniref:phosphoribosyl-AMP cyclohydrolase n=1 Tax=Pseudomonas putida TaxID=303 RepID=UPI0009A17A10|nr:phosphoribosyl-AMP cyclohydrolase [Pseudomonas putida]
MVFSILERSADQTAVSLEEVIRSLRWNGDGLIAAVAQQHDTGAVLMLAWMNEDALVETLATQRVCYWSRSRQQLWRKGETSGHRQQLVEARFDCDGDAILLLVDQVGPACHTGRPSCFYNVVHGREVRVTGNAGDFV